MGIGGEVTFDQKFDHNWMDGIPIITHCHHHRILTGKVARASDQYGGTSMLPKCAEDAMRPLLVGGFLKNGTTDSAAKLAAGAEYCVILGVGMMQVCGDAAGGEATRKAALS